MARIIFFTYITENYVPSASRFLSSLHLLKSADVYVLTKGFDLPDAAGYKTVTLPPTLELPLHLCPQQGQLIEFLPNVTDDDIVVMADADASLQRDLTPDEVFWMENIGDMVGLGFNMKQGQSGAEEAKLCRPLVSTDEIENVLGMKLSELMVYNCGLSVAKPATWRKVRAKFEELWPKFSPLFREWRCCQMALCAAIRLAEISVVNAGYALHTHGHFPLTKIHAIKDRVMYYGNRPVFFVHHVKGFW